MSFKYSNDRAGGPFLKVDFAEETPNLLDIFYDDPSTLMLTVDQSSFAGKTSVLPYYGTYTISIEGGDSLSCCD